MQRRSFVMGATAAALLPATGPCASAATLDTRIRQTQWSAIRGVNFIPSYARNLFETWRYYDHAIFDNELRLVRSVGYTSIRLWLNYFAYAERGERMVDDVEDALALCRAHGLQALIVLFDGCGVRPRRPARVTTIGAAYAAFQADADLSPERKKEAATFYEAFARGPGRDVRIEVADDTPTHVLLWQHWQQSPGFDRMDPSAWPALDTYIRALLARLAGNPAVIGWDLMNEPEFSAEDMATGLKDPGVRKTVGIFLEHVRAVIKKEGPGEPVTIGFASLAHCEEFAALADVLSYHVYGQPEALRESFSTARELGQRLGKPIIVTETLANFAFPPLDVGRLATDEGQLEHYRRIVPVLMESGLGWMGWGMIVGRLFNPYCDIVYSNGLPRPAATYLRGVLRGASNS